MAVKDNKPTSSRKAPETVSSDVYKEEKPSPLSIEGIRSGAVQSKILKGFIVLSGLLMAGSYILPGLLNGNRDTVPGMPPAATTGTVATVGDQNVTGVQLANTFARQQQFNEQYGQRTNVATYMSSKQQALQGLTDNAANVVAAQAAGITVSDADVDAEINKEIGDVFKPQAGQSEAAFRRMVEAQYGSMQAAKDKMLSQIDADAREGIRKKLLVDKLEKKIKDDAKSTEDDYKRSVTKLKLWQIVIRPKFPTPGTKDIKTETEKNNNEAKARAEKVFATLKAAPTLAYFKATAQKSSDDVSTKNKGGDFGWKLPSELYYGPEIGDALSKTAGNLAGPFSDASGSQYIFYIENRKTELPKDYAKNKKKLLADFETQQDNAVWQKKQDEYKKAQTPEVSDPALSAYQLQSTDLLQASGDAQKKMRDDAIARYTDALKGNSGIEAAAINYQLSQLYRDQNDKQKQQDALAAAVKEKSDDANLRLEYARVLREGGKPKEALVQVKAASTAVDASPSPPSPFGGPSPDDGLRQQIAAEFDALKEPKLAAAVRAKIKPAAPGGMGGMGGFGGLPPGIKIQPGQ